MLILPQTITVLFFICCEQSMTPFQVSVSTLDLTVNSRLTLPQHRHIISNPGVELFFVLWLDLFCLLAHLCSQNNVCVDLTDLSVVSLWHALVSGLVSRYERLEFRFKDSRLKIGVSMTKKGLRQRSCIHSTHTQIEKEYSPACFKLRSLPGEVCVWERGAERLLSSLSVKNTWNTCVSQATGTREAQGENWVCVSFELSKAGKHKLYVAH